MGKKGHVLAQVLITGVIVSVIAVGLVQMVLLRYTATQRTMQSSQKKRAAEGALSHLATYWNLPANGVCSDVGGYTCTGAAGTCGCTCTRTNYPTVVTAVYTPASGPNECRMTITVDP
jgi:Tfp pilus assembly major pilin PilA